MKARCGESLLPISIPTTDRERICRCRRTRQNHERFRLGISGQLCPRVKSVACPTATNAAPPEPSKKLLQLPRKCGEVSCLNWADRLFPLCDRAHESRELSQSDSDI